MPKVACEVFAGFVFVNLVARTRCRCARSSATGSCELEAYPFDQMTQRYGFSTRINGNWKLAVDSVCEWYHPPYVHGRFIDPDVSKAEKMVPPVDAYHYDVFPPAPADLGARARRRCRRASRARPGQPAREQRWVYKLFRAGLFGPDDVPDIGELPEFLNKGGIAVVGQRPVLAVPEPVDPDLGAELLHHLHVLARVGRLAHLRDRPLLRAAGQRHASASPRSSWSTARSSSPCRT